MYYRAVSFLSSGNPRTSQLRFPWTCYQQAVRHCRVKELCICRRLSILCGHVLQFAVGLLIYSNSITNPQQIEVSEVWGLKLNGASLVRQVGQLSEWAVTFSRAWPLKWAQHELRGVVYGRRPAQQRIVVHGLISFILCRRRCDRHVGARPDLWFSQIVTCVGVTVTVTDVHFLCRLLVCSAVSLSASVCSSL